MSSEKRIILLNGPAGVGKTTIGGRLAATAANGICIHGDDIKNFVVTREDRKVETGLTYVAGALLANMYLNAGYELIVFEFIFSTSANVARFQEALTADVPVRLITLWTALDIVMSREVSRTGRTRLEERVPECWRELFVNLGELGTIVDATPPADEVLRAVLAIVQ